MKEMATHTSIFAWRIPWTEESGRSMGSQESDRTELSTHMQKLLVKWNLDFSQKKS